MSKRNYKKWTDDEDLVIISMRAEKKSSKEIAKALGRSISSVNCRCGMLINQCKLSKTSKTKINYHDIADCASLNFGNLSKGFKNYAKEQKVSYYTIRNAYYVKKPNRVRAKDIKKNNIIMFGKSGIIANAKNSKQKPKKDTLWHKLKGWLLSQLLS